VTGPRGSAPSVFRILLPAKDLEASRRFYESLLATSGRSVAGGRLYFDCGPVILGILDRSEVPSEKWSVPTEAVYFGTGDLLAVHARARELGCLDKGLIHGDPANPAGEIVVRPWGERSFYATDPSGNPLCFVDDLTRFTGTPAQVAALASGRKPPASNARSARVSSGGTKASPHRSAARARRAATRR
jgi:hypothetical protein